MKNALSYRFLNGTKLKLIALITMTIDHIGLLIMCNFLPFRIIGRMAFPIFAFMIAEGCRYTKNRIKYFSVIFGLGIILQTVYIIFDNSYYMNILITLGLSILIIYSIQFAKSKKSVFSFLLPIAVISEIFLLDAFLKVALKNTNYALDYTFAGVMLPVLISLFDKHEIKIIMAAIGLIFVAFALGNKIQLFSLLALIPLLFYSGKPGKHRLKWLFYLYYPLHLALLYLIA